MEALVREASLEDLPEIQRLNSDLFEYDRERDPHMNFNWPYAEGEEYFRERIEKNGCVVVAEIDGEVVGYLCGAMTAKESYQTTRKAELENMYVDPQFRHMGIGHQMVARLLEWSTRHGADQVFVEAAWGNDQAIDFYQSEGFRPYYVALQTDLSEPSVESES